MCSSVPRAQITVLHSFAAGSRPMRSLIVPLVGLQSRMPVSRGLLSAVSWAAQPRSWVVRWLRPRVPPPFALISRVAPVLVLALCFCVASSVSAVVVVIWHRLRLCVLLVLLARSMTARRGAGLARLHPSCSSLSSVCIYSYRIPDGLRVAHVALRHRAAVAHLLEPDVLEPQIVAARASLSRLVPFVSPPHRAYRPAGYLWYSLTLPRTTFHDTAGCRPTVHTVEVRSVHRGAGTARSAVPRT